MFLGNVIGISRTVVVIFGEVEGISNRTVVDICGNVVVIFRIVVWIFKIVVGSLRIVVDSLRIVVDSLRIVVYSVKFGKQVFILELIV